MILVLAAFFVAPLGAASQDELPLGRMVIFYFRSGRKRGVCVCVCVVCTRPRLEGKGDERGGGGDGRLNRVKGIKLLCFQPRGHASVFNLGEGAAVLTRTVPMLLTCRCYRVSPSSTFFPPSSLLLFFLLVLFLFRLKSIEFRDSRALDEGTKK